MPILSKGQQTGRVRDHHPTLVHVTSRTSYVFHMAKETKKMNVEMHRMACTTKIPEYGIFYCVLGNNTPFHASPLFS